MRLRSTLAVPMLREGCAQSGRSTWRDSKPGPFADRQIDLLKTFADQAVIAIENVRLSQELQARTRELSRSVQEAQAGAGRGQPRGQRHARRRHGPPDRRLARQ